MLTYELDKTLLNKNKVFNNMHKVYTSETIIQQLFNLPDEDDATSNLD